MDRQRIIAFLAGFKKLLYKALIVVALSGLISFIYSKELVHLLVKATGIKLYYLSLPEVLLASVTLSIYAGIFFAVPVILCLVWHELRDVVPLRSAQGYMFAVFSTILFYLGSLFCYFIVLPSGIKFLIDFGSGNKIMPMISVERFVLFCAGMMLACGMTFEVPIVLLVLGKIGILKVKTLVRTRRFAILFITIAAAIITPTPDVYNMALVAVPTYVLYEIGIILLKIEERKKRKRRDQDSR